tara:strand:- start:545 stop:658 length:114 start_codon:yes stop_codon:yes gene_type:complete
MAYGKSKSKGYPKPKKSSKSYPKGNQSSNGKGYKKGS